MNSADYSVYRDQTLSKLFQTTLANSRTCRDCGEIVTETELEAYIRIPVTTGGDEGLRQPTAYREDAASLKELILATWNAHDEHGTCNSEECTEARQLAEQLESDVEDSGYDVIQRIKRGADVLCIELGRNFFVDGEGIKRCDDVDYPDELDLSEFTEDGLPLKYRLYGVSAHTGPNTFSGHYIAVVRHRNGREFRTINDDEVSRRGQTFEAALYPESYDTDFNPALLFYVKTEGK